MNIMLGLYVAAVAALVMNSTWAAITASVVIIIVMFASCVINAPVIEDRE